MEFLSAIGKNEDANVFQIGHEIMHAIFKGDSRDHNPIRGTLLASKGNNKDNELSEEEKCKIVEMLKLCTFQKCCPLKAKEAKAKKGMSNGGNPNFSPMGSTGCNSCVNAQSQPQNVFVLHGFQFLATGSSDLFISPTCAIKANAE